MARFDKSKVHLIDGPLLEQMLKFRIAGVDGQIVVTQLPDGTWSIGLDTENDNSGAELYEFEVDEDGSLSIFTWPATRVEEEA